jgi:putative FmdB family regulatory protein
MPTYEYECSACGHRFEKFQSITAAPVRTCPRCGKGRVRRLLGTGAALLFKGPGFYATDYKRAGRPEAAKKEPAAEAAPAAKKDGAAEPSGGSKAKEK